MFPEQKLHLHLEKESTVNCLLVRVEERAWNIKSYLLTVSNIWFLQSEEASI